MMQGVDIMVIKILTNFPDSLGYQFSYQLAEENLLDKCRYVVMRVIGDVPKKNAAYFGGYNISQFFKGKNCEDYEAIKWLQFDIAILLT